MADVPVPKQKRPYSKPTITRIDLLAEQQVGASCKSATGGGKGATFPNPCRTKGGGTSNACKTTQGS